MKARQAKRLPINCGPAAWNAILGEYSNSPELENDITADFVIIGAGFAGLSAARRLLQLQPKAEIVIVDATRIGKGGTGRNSGFMIDLPHDLASQDYAGPGNDKALIAMNRMAIEFGRQAVDEYAIDKNYFDPSGKINGAVSAKAAQHNLSYAKHLENLNETSQLLDEKQMLEITGSSHYRSGLYTAGTVMLQPAGYIRGLATGLKKQLKLFENSAVTKFSKHGKDWKVQTKKGSVTAPKIILATNGHLESFGFQQGRLMQVFLFASMTVELEKSDLKKLGGNPRWGVTPSDPMGTTMRRIDNSQGGNRIITRTCAKLLPDMNPNQNHVDWAAKIHRKKFNQRYPSLSNIKMEYKWAGHLCMSLNSVSVTNEIDDGVYSACVQNGLGTTKGTLSGIAAAELACGSKSQITEFFMQEDRPKKLPPRPFSTIGANAWMRYKEWVAKEE